MLPYRQGNMQIFSNVTHYVSCIFRLVNSRIEDTLAAILNHRAQISTSESCIEHISFGKYMCSTLFYLFSLYDAQIGSKLCKNTFRFMISLMVLMSVKITHAWRVYQQVNSSIGLHLALRLPRTVQRFVSKCSHISRRSHKLNQDAYRISMNKDVSKFLCVTAENCSCDIVFDVTGA